MKKITILLLSAVAIASGCKRFTDINQNPNDPTSVTPNVVLSAALAASGNSVGTDQFALNEWMGYWARSGNYISVQSTEQYQLNTTYADGTWQDLYGTISKYDYIEKTALANAGSEAFYIGVAKTMKALHFGQLIDMFGNVPYAQAFQINKYTTPAYDDASGIYAKLITQLDSAVYYFGVATTQYAHASSAVINTDDQYDIMFGRGQSVNPTLRMQEWTWFANTVKLRLLMNVAKAAPSGVDIAGEITKAVSSGGFLPAGTLASVNPGYGNSKASQLMPFYGQFYTTAGNPTAVTSAFNRADTYAVNFYNATSDTYRPPLVYVPLSNGSIGSNYDGDLQALTNSFTSGIGTGLTKTASSDQIILGDFESLFLQSEAAARGFNVGSDPESLLKAAIEQNFVYVGDNAGDADTYYSSNASNPDVDYAAAVANVGKLPAGVDATPGLQAVLTQEWIALNGIDWFQEWTNYRRTAFPTSDVLGISHANSHVKNAIPYRYLYPQSEYDTNGKNIPTLANGAYTPIFWDKLH